MKLYTNSRYSKAAAGTELFLKLPGRTAARIPAVDGFYTIDTPDTPCVAYYQELDSNGCVIASGEFAIYQDLANADPDFDPRTPAEITLEALEAKIAGRALTIQQSKITVGDRSIEYMNSIDELIKWRDYFKSVVAKEKGHASFKAQVCRLRRNI